MKNALSALVILFNLFITDLHAKTNSTNESVLETKVTYFSASQKNKEVIINWKTSAEKNHTLFTIEKSNDGVNFNLVTTEVGTGSNLSEHEYYSFDFLPTRGTSFYRLSQKNEDGSKTVFEIQKIVYQVELTFIPNKEDNQYAIFGIPKNTHAVITLMDKDNKVVSNVPHKDNGALMIDLLDYSDAVYYVKIKDDFNEWIRIIEK
jgi:hypothetical protein